jgi:hypothetical protein
VSFACVTTGMPGNPRDGFSFSSLVEIKERI